MGCGHKEVCVTHLKKLMLEELERRNYAASTTRAYLRAVDEYARYFNRSPDQAWAGGSHPPIPGVSVSRKKASAQHRHPAPGRNPVLLDQDAESNRGAPT